MRPKKLNIKLLIMAVLFIVGMFPITTFASSDEIVYGHYENGKWVAGQLGQELPDGVVAVDKTATKLENGRYKITLKVIGEQSEQAVASAIVLVIDASSSMEKCTCCAEKSRHKLNCVYYAEGKSVKQNQSRIYAAKNAAKDFINGYAGDTSDIDKYVSIVPFSNKAASSQWFNVTKNEDKSQAIDYISNINTAVGTHLQDALREANSKLGDPTINKIDNTEVIVLSDGAPSLSVSQKNPYGSKVVNDETSADAELLKNKTIVYTICLDEFNEHTYSGGETVGDFLRNRIATSSSHAFDVNGVEELSEHFNSMSQTVGLNLNGCIVHDGNAKLISTELPSNVTRGDNGFTWILTKPSIENLGNAVRYTYTLQYIAVLDAKAPEFEENVLYPLNGRTYLDIPNVGEVDFLIPAASADKPSAIDEPEPEEDECEKPPAGDIEDEPTEPSSDNPEEGTTDPTDENTEPSEPPASDEEPTNPVEEPTKQAIEEPTSTHDEGVNTSNKVNHEEKTSDTSDEQPQTGDDMNLPLYIGLMLAAITAIAITFIRKEKE